MATMLRLNPFREMTRIQHDLDRMFDLVYNGNNNGNGDSTWGLPLDVIETDDGFHIIASVPGINVDELDITFTDNVLTIRGQFTTPDLPEGVKYHVRERRLGNFVRSINLPMAINADEIAANYVDGVLMLRVPKAEEVKPRRIAVTAGKGPNILEG